MSAAEPTKTASPAQVAEENLDLLCDLTNMKAYDAPQEDGSRFVLFIGKNPLGEDSAELLNRMQVDGALVPAGKRPKQRGFAAIVFDEDNFENLEDLREATNGSSARPLYAPRLLAAPGLAPVVWIMKPKPKQVQKERKERASDHGNTFANDAGDISRPWSSWADRWTWGRPR